jgi:hypothetical protein
MLSGEMGGHGQNLGLDPNGYSSGYLQQQLLQIPDYPIVSTSLFYLVLQNV